jgi:pimeloyl-ACP methyl ester carboxylesterase
MAHFIFIPGAWHGAWCWERIVPALEAAGHQVQTPDLLGMGSDKTPLSDVTYAKWIDQVAGLLDVAAEPVILMGHSRGGLVISDAAERRPDKVAMLVYLTAFLNTDGMSLIESWQRVPRPDQQELATVNADGSTTLIADRVAPVLYNTTPPEWAAKALKALGPEPKDTFVTPIHVTTERFGGVRRAYIECAEDKSILIELQKLMQSDLPCEVVHTIAADHSPFFSAPDKLIEALLKIAESALHVQAGK